MPLFPEIDVTELARSAAVNGVSDPPAGVLAGLNQSLINVLRNFDPGAEGVCNVNPTLQLTLPIPEWAEWSWLEAATTASITAGSGTSVVLFEVPADERVTLWSCRVARATGDNEVQNFNLDWPTGYFSSSNDLEYYQPDAAASIVFWPNPAVDPKAYTPPGILLEPSTQIRFQPSGAGVSASTFAYKLLLRRTKVIRALVP